jgi:hypothetical protein
MTPTESKCALRLYRTAAKASREAAAALNTPGEHVVNLRAIHLLAEKLSAAHAALLEVENIMKGFPDPNNKNEPTPST